MRTRKSITARLDGTASRKRPLWTHACEPRKAAACSWRIREHATTSREARRIREHAAAMWPACVKVRRGESGRVGARTHALARSPRVVRAPA
eukprot:6673150-Prymnesium_polylepis.2